MRCQQSAFDNVRCKPLRIHANRLRACQESLVCTGTASESLEAVSWDHGVQSSKGSAECSKLASEVGDDACRDPDSKVYSLQLPFRPLAKPGANEAYDPLAADAGTGGPPPAHPPPPGPRPPFVPQVLTHPSPSLLPWTCAQRTGLCQHQVVHLLYVSDSCMVELRWLTFPDR